LQRRWARQCSNVAAAAASDPPPEA
jgi:hypothetical protein